MEKRGRRQHVESRSMLPIRRINGVLRRRWKGIVVGVVALCIIAWAIAPAVRAVALVRGPAGRSAPDVTQAGMPVETVHFPATDGVRLSGWLAAASPRAPTVILVHGFKGSRVAMLPWAHFLYAAGYNVLLFDDRGCGESEGWAITLGAREADDLIGAVQYLEGRADLPVKRYGAIGVSLGAGVVLLAAAREPALAAVVADSAWTDERAQLDHMGTLPIGPFAVPALPYEPAMVDALIGARLEDVRPLAAIPRIAPRAVLLIHSADDGNTTTPLSGERALYAAAGEPKAQWIAPSGGHAGALQAHPQEYEHQVLTFFTAHLGVSAAP